MNIKSTSVYATTYTKSLSGGATETITLAPATNVTAYGYNNVNELTSIAPGGAALFKGTANKALKSATVNSNPATLNWTEEFQGNATLSTGNNNIPVAVTDGANNTKTNSYQVVAGTGSSASPTFDANGNMTSDGTNTYAWDAENRLIQVTYPGSGNNSQFTISSIGQNVKIVENSGGSPTSTKQFVWCGMDRAEERGGGGSLSKKFFSRGQTLSGTNYYYLKDHLGTIMEMVDSSGNIQAKYQFDPYGRAKKHQGSLESDFQYAGYYFHTQSKLNLTLTRAYNSELGRWINRDPIEELAGINLYQYVWNNPLSFLDPLGLDPDTGRDPDGGCWCGPRRRNDILKWFWSCYKWHTVWGEWKWCFPIPPGMCGNTKPRPDPKDVPGLPMYQHPGSPPWNPSATSPRLNTV